MVRRVSTLPALLTTTSLTMGRRQDHWTSDKPDLYNYQPVLDGRAPLTMQI